MVRFMKGGTTIEDRGGDEVRGNRANRFPVRKRTARIAGSIAVTPRYTAAQILQALS
jgi:hypothetical protein